MREVKDATNTLYDCRGGWQVMVSHCNGIQDVWIRHKDYGDMMYMFGLIDSVMEDEWLDPMDIIDGNLDWYKQDYISKYMTEAE